MAEKIANNHEWLNNTHAATPQTLCNEFCDIYGYLATRHASTQDDRETPAQHFYGATGPSKTPLVGPWRILDASGLSMTPPTDPWRNWTVHNATHSYVKSSLVERISVSPYTTHEQIRSNTKTLLLALVQYKNATVQPHDLEYYWFRNWLKKHNFPNCIIPPNIHSFIRSFTDSFLHAFFHSFIDPFHALMQFIHSFIHSFIHWFYYSFIHSFIHSLINFIQSFIHQLTHSFIRFMSSISFIQQSIQPFIYSIHACIHSFIRSFISIVMFTSIRFMACHVMSYHVKSYHVMPFINSFQSSMRVFTD